MSRELLEELKQFLDYAEKEGVLDIEVIEELKDFAEEYVKYSKK